MTWRSFGCTAYERDGAGMWPAVAAACVLGIAFAVGRYREQMLERRRAIDVAGTVALAREVGNAVGHSPEVIFMAPSYGKPLSYYGDLSGRNWPQSLDFRLATLQGITVPRAEERFNEMTKQVIPEYFIVTNLAEFESRSPI